MSRAQHVLTISAVMFDMMKEDLFSKDTQAFVENMASTMKERAQKLSREMTAQLIDDLPALTAHADTMRSILKFIDELPKDIERGKKYRDNPVFMKTALERSCYLYAQFQAMEMGLR